MTQTPDIPPMQAPPGYDDLGPLPPPLPPKPGWPKAIGLISVLLASVLLALLTFNLVGVDMNSSSSFLDDDLGAFQLRLPASHEQHRTSSPCEGQSDARSHAPRPDDRNAGGLFIWV